MKKDLIEVLKDKVWEQYMGVKGGDFEMWLEGLSPIQKLMWKSKFNGAEYTHDIEIIP